MIGQSASPAVHRRLRVRGLAALVLTMVLGLGLVGADARPAVAQGRTPAARPVGSGDITFASRRQGGRGQIWVMRSDGGSAIQLTSSSDTAIVNGQPDWAPDGKRIAFVSSRSGNREIFVMAADGSDPMQLTNHPSVDEAPVWSPDGRRLAFHTDRDGDFELYLLDLDSRALTRLTTHAGVDKFPDWSPDGRTIAFQRDGDVHVLDVRSRAVRRLTETPELDDMPAWSRDGGRIAFMSQRDGYASIYVMRADGSGRVNLTPKPAEVPVEDWTSMWPSWSRDGRSIYFQGIRPETQRDMEIYVVRADGGRPTRLTAVRGVDSAPVAR